MKVQLSSGLANQTAKTSIDQKLLTSYRNMLSDVKSLNSPEAFTRVHNCIHAANRIFIYGLGSSGLAAQELNYRLSWMGFTCESITDPHLMLIRSTLLQAGEARLLPLRPNDRLTSIHQQRPATRRQTHRHRPIWVRYEPLYLIDRISLQFLADPEREALFLQTVDAINSRGNE